MNKRIRKLAEQAGIEFDDDFPLEPETIYYYKLSDFEKFGELIVRECYEQSMSIGRYNTPSGITPDLAIAIAVGLKKHFGVDQ